MQEFVLLIVLFVLGLPIVLLAMFYFGGEHVLAAIVIVVLIFNLGPVVARWLKKRVQTIKE